MKRKLLKQLFWYLLIASLLSNIIGQELFVFTRPRAAVPAAGRVYPLNVHGTVVYLTYVEHLITGQINFAIAVLTGFVWMLLARREVRRDGSL